MQTIQHSEMKRRSIRGSEMAYVDAGNGRPVVFLHGNPTSSFIWRDIIPHVSGTHRAIAPDLIGMGRSAKPDIDYTYQDQAAHLHELLDELDLEDAVLVVQDWGSGLGFHYARTRPERVSAIAFMEAMVPPIHPIASLDVVGPFKDFLQGLRTEGVGEQMVLEQNVFVEQFLGGGGANGPLADEVMEVYRAAFPTPESRKPVLQWPRQIPVGGDPADVYEVVRANSDWLLENSLPKLLFHAAPGAIVTPEVTDFLKANMQNLETIDLGAGGHFLQEEHPDAIGAGLAEWLTRV